MIGLVLGTLVELFYTFINQQEPVLLVDLMYYQRNELSRFCDDDKNHDGNI